MVLIEALAHIGFILLGVIVLGCFIFLAIRPRNGSRSDELGYQLVNGLIIFGGCIAGTSSLCTAVIYLANNVVAQEHSLAWIGSLIGMLIGVWGGVRLYTRFTL